MLIDVEKLEKLFEAKYKIFDQNEDDAFMNYCDNHGIIFLHHDWVQDEFNKPRRGMICVMNPEKGDTSDNVDYCPWLLVPKKIAEKALVLGSLP